MTLYSIAAAVIAVALIALLVAIRERPQDRATSYPSGSAERRALEMK